jgi:hypothetical protein
MHYYINHPRGYKPRAGVARRTTGSEPRSRPDRAIRTGLEYRSWHQGRGARSSASSATMTAAGDSSRSSGPTAAATSGVRSASHEKPWVLRGRPHGTQVVLLGQHEREDTTQAPKSVTEGRQRCSRKSCSQHAASATRRTGAATTSPRSCRPPH